MFIYQAFNILSCLRENTLSMNAWALTITTCGYYYIYYCYCYRYFMYFHVLLKKTRLEMLNFSLNVWGLWPPSFWKSCSCYTQQLQNFLSLRCPFFHSFQNSWQCWHPSSQLKLLSWPIWAIGLSSGNRFTDYISANVVDPGTDFK